jgi:ribosomal protein S3
LNRKRYRGIALQFSGRAYGAKKAMSFKISQGRIPTNTLKAKIGYSQLTQQTRNGA